MQVPIVLIGRFRYANSSVMGVGHDWAEENADLTWVVGLMKVDTFHIAPDMGMAVYYFREPFVIGHLISFLLIWIALAFYSFDSIRREVSKVDMREFT